jgi:hypothetical protein
LTPAEAYRVRALWAAVHDHFHESGPRPLSRSLAVKSRWAVAVCDEVKVDGLTAAAMRKAGVPFARELAETVLLERLFRLPAEPGAERSVDAAAGVLMFEWLLRHDGGLAEGAGGELAVDLALVGTAAGLLGEPVVPHQVVASPKPPGAGRVEWHQEYRSLYAHGLRRADAVLAMVALDAAPVQAGCLQVAVASHRLGLLPHHRQGGQEVACELALADRPRRLLPARPGDVVVFHALTAHASDPNATARPRRAVVVCYRAAGRLVRRHR